MMGKIRRMNKNNSANDGSLQNIDWSRVSDHDARAFGTCVGLLENAVNYRFQLDAVKNGRLSSLVVVSTAVMLLLLFGVEHTTVLMTALALQLLLCITSQGLAYLSKKAVVSAERLLIETVVLLKKKYPIKEDTYKSEDSPSPR